jgi:DNA-binding MarR family transcriptional regulator
MGSEHYRVESYRSHESVGHLVKRAHVRCAAEIEPALAGRGLTHVQFGILIALRDRIALGPRDLISKLSHDSGALSRVLDQLESKGWVHRHRSAHDRRTVDLSLTDAGQAAVEGALPVIVQTLNGALSRFTRPEVEEFVRLLQKFVEE